jgi:hypothetical protein
VFPNAFGDEESIWVTSKGQSGNEGSASFTLLYASELEALKDQRYWFLLLKSFHQYYS